MKKHVKFLAFIFLASAIEQGRAAEVSFTLPGNISVYAEEVPFISNEHAVTDCLSPYKNCRIDGSIAYGVTDKIRTYFKIIEIGIAGKKYALDATGMYNPSFSKSDIGKRFGGFCYDENNCAFRGVFSDAGGTYSAEWEIRNGLVWRSILSDDLEISQMFLANISPPKYK